MSGEENPEDKGPLEPTSPPIDTRDPHLYIDPTEEHNLLLAKQRAITHAIEQLPEIVQYIKTLPTQKDIENAIMTKLQEYDKGLKTQLNDIIGKMGARMEELSSLKSNQQPQQSGGWADFLKPFIERMMNSGQIPGLGGGSTLDKDIDIINNELMNRWKLKYRNDMNAWLNSTLPPIGVMASKGMTIIDTTANPQGLVH